MELYLNISQGVVVQKKVTLSAEEIVREIGRQTGFNFPDDCVEDGKVLRWKRVFHNNCADDVLFDRMGNPGEYEVASIATEDVELANAVKIVCEAISANKRIGG